MSNITIIEGIPSHCPHCNKEYDSTKDSEEATVGGITLPNAIRHITCPICNKCMGCSKEPDNNTLILKGKICPTTK